MYVYFFFRKFYFSECSIIVQVYVPLDDLTRSAEILTIIHTLNN